MVFIELLIVCSSPIIPVNSNAEYVYNFSCYKLTSTRSDSVGVRPSSNNDAGLQSLRACRLATQIPRREKTKYFLLTLWYCYTPCTLFAIWETLRRGTEKEQILASFFSQYQTLGRPLNSSLDAHGSRWNFCLLLINAHFHLTTAFSTLETTKFRF